MSQPIIRSELPLPEYMPLRLRRLLDSALTGIVWREPQVEEQGRWRNWLIDGKSYDVAQPVTFTPYASASPCSARCRFCSETLQVRQQTKLAAAIRPEADYFLRLRAALHALRGLPISYSLSGLETTDNAQWMLAMLDELEIHAAASHVGQRILYSNGAGLADSHRGDLLMHRLAGFGIDWVEVSRHHDDPHINQTIMRFRAGLAIAGQACFESMLRRLHAHVPVKLVCIVQQGGIDDVAGVMRYLDWARAQGVRAVIFREFSMLNDNYRDNVTSRYIAASRVAMDHLLEDCLRHPVFSSACEMGHATAGYYFWNVVTAYRDMEVTFEASDYARMHAQHDSGRIYKLVFHANGNLCAGWDPWRNVLLKTKPLHEIRPDMRIAALRTDI